MIILLSGEDTYRSRQRLIKLKNAFKEKYDPRGLNIVTLEGKTLTQENFNQAVATHGFLSTRRMLVIENLSDNKSKVVRETVRDTLSELPAEENIVILWEGKPGGEAKRKKKTEPLFGLKPGKGVVIETFESLAGAKLSGWIKAECAQRRVTIEPKASALLIVLVGDDLWRMSSEIDKLANYTQGAAITEADVVAVVRAQFDMDIFKLTDALATKDRVTALKLLDDQISGGTPVMYLVTMVIRQFRILIQVKDYLERNEDPRQLAQTLGLHPFVAQKAVAQAKRFTLDQLKKIYQELVRLDERMKSSGFDQRIFFDVFAVEATE
ncbi:MAG: DNA polymerase III subunit delta [Patescibacteria group bacterium]